MSEQFKYIIGQPGGPSGPFWSIVRSDGRLIAIPIGIDWRTLKQRRPQRGE